MSNKIEEVKKFLAYLEKIQSNENSKEIYFEHDPTGLGAQISRRVLALRIASITGYKAVFHRETMYPYINPYLPMSEGRLSVEEQKALPIYSALNLLQQNAYLFDFWKFWENEEEKKLIYNYIPEGLKDLGPEVYEGAMISFMKLRQEFEVEINQAKKRLGLEGPYIGLHYRRGDKKVETPYVPADKYIKEVVGISRNFGISRVYIASDSPNAVSEMRLDKYGIEVVFDKEEIRYNNANHKFLMKNQNLAAQETLSAIKNIYLLSNSVAIIGQTNAHFATIAYSLLAYSRGTNNGCGTLIKGEVMLDKIHIGMQYKIKNYIKNIVKLVLPGMTLKGKRIKK